MKKLAALALFALCSCSGKDNSAPKPATAKQPDPLCACMTPPLLPHLTDPQKKTVLATLAAQSLNEGVVNTFLFGGGSQDPAATELLKMLTDSHCLKETKQDQDGRSLGRIYGDACPVLASTSFLNSSTSAGSKEDRSIELTVRTDDYAAKSQLQKYDESESADGKVQETSPKHFHVDMRGSNTGGLTVKSGITFQGSLQGSADVDMSDQNEVKILALDLRADSILHFDGFDAELLLTAKGAGNALAVELYLNGEKIPFPAALAAEWKARITRATVRRALSGI
jgi:hypothetical protein